MVRAYSSDLRDRVVSAVMSGATVRSVASRFGVSVASVVKWSQRYRTTGSAAAKPYVGSRPHVLVGEREWLLARIAEKPDLTLRAIQAELAERGVKASYHAVWAFFAREGMSFKKSLFGSEQDRPDVAWKRDRWRRHQAKFDPRRLVFVDETWAKTNMTRTHGRCARGQRLVDKVPHGHWKTLTFLAALRHDRIDAPFVLDGPINGDYFRAWVEQCLVPTLAPGDVVILDNLGSHKGKAVRRALRKAKAHLIFLPPYSPDLNPIEQVFAKLKTLLRKAAERTVEATWRRIGQLLDHFTPAECANYLANSGYASV
ncbi:MAG TPA: IS630 family transposase [Phenylobacterium sp.]|uniref:IS630 family transposase n=1 Tax=Phenylobacterium sp. TaxID=1871053 RepID=UPI002B4947F0|nr:IS630 family transposase [Phenylobacterium sp.]HKR90377.1 IS630 family transposase [Phenylobacterium sp.]